MVVSDEATHHFLVLGISFSEASEVSEKWCPPHSAATGFAQTIHVDGWREK